MLYFLIFFKNYEWMLVKTILHCSHHHISSQMGEHTSKDFNNFLFTFLCRKWNTSLTFDIFFLPPPPIVRTMSLHTDFFFKGIPYIKILNSFISCLLGLFETWEVLSLLSRRNITKFLSVVNWTKPTNQAVWNENCLAQAARMESLGWAKLHKSI